MTERPTVVLKGLRRSRDMPVLLLDKCTAIVVAAKATEQAAGSEQQNCGTGPPHTENGVGIYRVSIRKKIRFVLHKNANRHTEHGQ